MTKDLDPHHCHCFSVKPQDIEEFKNQLENFGFYHEFEEDHGQIFGRVLRIDDQLQLHVKVMPDGSIESEMEPSVAYPGAHLNPEHSYSAHTQLQELFAEHISLPSYVVRNVPSTCKNPVIKKPNNPMHAKTIVTMGILGVLGAAALHYLSKEEDDKTEYL